MNILMIHNYYQIGGGEHTVFKNEVSLLRENGHNVIEYTRSNNELKKSKIKVLLLPLTAIWSWKTYFEVRKIIKHGKIDIVHCHNTFPLISPSVYYAARSKKIPVLQTIHNFRLLCPNGFFFCKGKICDKCKKNGNYKNAIKNKCYRNSKLQTHVLVAMLNFHKFIGTYKKISYIFLTNYNRLKFDDLLDINSNQVFIKPNFVKKPKIDKIVSTDKYFVYAGRIEKNKGIISLVKMWKEFSSEYVLHIFGEGPDVIQLKDIIRDSENIIYYGFKEQDILYKDYSGAIASIIPSESIEAFGMGIPESFSIGVPVVCTKIENIENMVSVSKGGETYSIGNFDELKEALDLVIKNRTKYSQCASEYYNSYLSDTENYKRIIEIYGKAKFIK